MSKGYFIDGFDLRAKPETIHLLLAEGPSEVGFMTRYLSQIDADVASTSIICFKGVSRIVGHTRTIVKLLGPGTVERLRGIGIMADSDTNPEGRIDTVIDCAKAFGFPRSGKDLHDTGKHEQEGRVFAYSLSPSRSREGSIEDLILDEVISDPMTACISDSCNCIASVSGLEVNKKAKVQMFISAKMNSSMAGVQHAFAAGLFDVNHEVWHEHRKMIDTVLGRGG